MNLVISAKTIKWTFNGHFHDTFLPGNVKRVGKKQAKMHENSLEKWDF